MPQGRLQVRSGPWRGSRYCASRCKMPFEIDGGVCDPSCQTTDVLKARLLADPGTNTSRASRSGAYTYQSGNPLLKHTLRVVDVLL
jgi:hypothetical protein